MQVNLLEILRISGLMKTSDRNKIVSSFKKNDNYCKILTNAKCLSEGVDIPELDGIAFIDPKKSQVDIIQAVGRAIRKSSEKKNRFDYYSCLSRRYSKYRRGNFQ